MQNSSNSDSSELPWSRMIVIGDSFAEGLGDPEPKACGQLRGWADRVAEVFAGLDPNFAYANLAVRGKVIRQIAAEQVAPALKLKPDLVFISAGGNDVLRPRSNPDQISQRLEKIVAEFSAVGATVVLFSAFDVKDAKVFRTVREKAAVFSQNIYSIANKHDALVVHCWGIIAAHDERYWDADRLHLNALGHHTVALQVLNTLNVPHNLKQQHPAPLPERSWRQARHEDVIWAREHFMPWVIRRVKRVSSGDNLSPKRPEALPLTVNGADADSSAATGAAVNTHPAPGTAAGSAVNLGEGASAKPERPERERTDRRTHNTHPNKAATTQTKAQPAKH
ncbi:SGNH/GDSL hydrolase family protein [Canibacter zhuwentaonis]|uniref:SGNH/GDSL hydrolase family protein n=1 Tax=Canibacter zhuwentaonis TaxID=2837491 RepID=UPI0032B3AD4D